MIALALTHIVAHDDGQQRRDADVFRACGAMILKRPTGECSKKYVLG